METNTRPVLPPDVAEYLVQASMAVAKEQNFQFNNEAQAMEWLTSNLKVIVDKARESMENLRITLLDNPRASEVVRASLNAAVYYRIRRQA
jgi:fructose-1,6-bisphosphatase/sedoheptulose 1,7-bisphosphatase-like protein